MMNFKEKQTVGFQARNLKREVCDYVGVILQVTEDEMIVLEAHSCPNFIKFDAAKISDHRVVLEDCPPSFKSFSNNGEMLVYIIIEEQYVWRFTEESCMQCQVELLDDGRCISERDWNAILSHPGAEQLVKEFTWMSRKRLPSDDDFGPK